jgi:hypothetical protein
MSFERDSIQAPFLPGAAVPSAAALDTLGCDRSALPGVGAIHEAVQVKPNRTEMKRRH